MSELQGRRALVTGGGVRLGRAIALELAAAGADVAVHAHSHETEAEETAGAIRKLGRRAVVVRADLGQGGEIARLFAEVEARLGAPDILINNAGIFERADFLDIEETALRRMLDLNLIAPFLCAREAARRMKAAGQGDIVNIIDVGGTSAAWKGFAHYCAAKAGLAMLTRVLAVELAPAVRVNGVSPGVILPSDEDGENDALRLARVPMQRRGEPEEVARTVKFLVAGPRYLTGQILAVDGGRSAAG